MKNFFRLIIVLLAFSCNSFEESTIMETEPEKTLEKFDFSPPILVNGILKFENEESLSFWLGEVRRMEPSEFSKWELSLGFRSFATIFDRLVDEENEASDSLTQAFKSSRIMPERIHSEFPIHSKNTLPYLPYLHVFHEGGIAPLASIIENGMERLINEHSEVIVSEQFIQYKDNNKLVNGKILKGSDIGLNLSVTTSPTGYSDRRISTIGNFRTITDLTFTIRQSGVFLNQNFGPLPTTGTNAWPEWNIILRNFRQGFFGWNTRKTTSLKIEGEISHGLKTCGVLNNFPALIDYNGTVNVNSGGSSTTTLVWTFNDPNLNFNQCYNFPISEQFKWISSLDLNITGEGNNVSNFFGIHQYQGN